MVQSVPVKNRGTVIGQAEITKIGLYYFIRAVCQFDNDGIQKLWISTKCKSIMLGTCIPIGGEFVLEKKISVKAIGEGDIQITAHEPTKETLLKRIPVFCSEPFPCLSKLKDCILVKESEKYWVEINIKNDN